MTDADRVELATLMLEGQLTRQMYQHPDLGYASFWLLTLTGEHKCEFAFDSVWCHSLEHVLIARHEGYRQWGRLWDRRVRCPLL
jgi:hypothetical protein